MNPAFGRAVEKARGPKLAEDQSGPQEQEKGARWVTIEGHHVLIEATQADRVRHDDGRTQTHTKAPKNSRDDVVLIPAGNGKPEANVDLNGIWTMSWTLREVKGDALVPPGSKYSSSKVELTESVNGGPFKPGGSQNGEFRDIISPESRTIIQRFSLDGRRVQIVPGKDADGNLIKTWDVRMTVKYPNAPVYSPVP
jgi:hypothetical protein